MPFFKMQSNETFLNPDEILEKASRLIAEVLEKPEKYVMVEMRENSRMLFGGNKDPLFYCELKSIGLPKDRTKEISKKITEFISNETGVSPERIYIEFSDAERPMWGWNGGTF
ncbi:MAG: phenylpyruvate tautomerase MIF-related protein [Bacteroidales bacterium]